MNARITETFRRALMQLQTELEELELMSRDATAPVALDQSMVGRLSRIDAIQGAEMAQEASRRRKIKLARIPTSLARIDAGDYGRCAECDEFIAEGRLHIDPTYARCVRCADL